MANDPLAAVTLWIVERGVAHVLVSATPLRAACGRDRWRRAAVTAELVEPRRVCAACRAAYESNPAARPGNLRATVERQLAFLGDWRDEP